MNCMFVAKLFANVYNAIMNIYKGLLIDNNYEDLLPINKCLTQGVSVHLQVFIHLKYLS